MTDIPLREAIRRQGFKPQLVEGEPPEPAPGWAGPDGMGEPAEVRIEAKPFVWRDPRSFPRRQWLYGRHLIRKFLSSTVAPGSVGKTSLILVEAVAMATGRNLLGVPVHGGPLTVWVINLEDPLEELERRVVAICEHFGVDPSELEGRLYLNSGRDTDLVVATSTKNGTTIAQPVVDALKAEIIAKGADVVVVDPLVKAHRVPENDNGAIDLVCTAFARIADEANCAFDLVHHVRKTNGAEVTIEDSRGAVALASAARSMRALNRMTKDEGEKLNIEEPHRYFRAETGKANLAPLDKADWFQLVSVSLGNGDSDILDNSDHVAVAEAWKPPNAFEDVSAADLMAVQKAISEKPHRADAQSTAWAGHAVAAQLGLDMGDDAAKQKVKQLLSTWTRNGMFREVMKHDGQRKPKRFLEVGQWA